MVAGRRWSRRIGRCLHHQRREPGVSRISLVFGWFQRSLRAVSQRPVRRHASSRAVGGANDSERSSGFFGGIDVPISTRGRNLCRTLRDL